MIRAMILPLLYIDYIEEPKARTAGRVRHCRFHTLQTRDVITYQQDDDEANDGKYKRGIPEESRDLPQNATPAASVALPMSLPEPGQGYLLPARLLRHL